MASLEGSLQVTHQGIVAVFSESQSAWALKPNRKARVLEQFKKDGEVLKK